VFKGGGSMHLLLALPARSGTITHTTQKTYYWVGWIIIVMVNIAPPAKKFWTRLWSKWWVLYKYIIVGIVAFEKIKNSLFFLKDFVSPLNCDTVSMSARLRTTLISRIRTVYDLQVRMRYLVRRRRLIKKSKQKFKKK
jgi:hypothetical protein